MRYGQPFAWLSPAFTFQRRFYSGLRFITGENNYYTILKVTPNATQEEIKKAYYKLSKLYHPDTNQSAEAHDIFTAINEAYNVLGNLSGRRKYDQCIAVRYNPSVDNKQVTKSQNFDGKRIVYDFDEWTQRYYQEAIRRRKRHFEMRKQFERRQVSDEMEVFNRNIIITAVLTLIGIVVMVNAKNDHI